MPTSPVAPVTSAVGTRQTEKGSAATSTRRSMRRRVRRRRSAASARSSAAPGSTSRRIIASAMPPSRGERTALRTSPTCVPAVVVQRGAARRRLDARARACRAGACSRGRGSARARPSPARCSSPSCTRSRAARRSSLPAGSSCRPCRCPHSGRPASTRAISHASSPAGVAPARDGALPQRVERIGGHDQLESFDAEVGHARDAASAALDLDGHVRVRRERGERRRRHAGQLADDVARASRRRRRCRAAARSRRRAARCAGSRTSAPSPPTPPRRAAARPRARRPPSTKTRTSATIFPFAVSAAA